MPTRDDLIADWRKRLADADQPPTESSSRPAWMTRLRVRLYRFLLSLYGDGCWHTAESPDEIRSPNSADATSAPLTLQGKPAKNAVTIRSALNSVAAARPIRMLPGTFAEGQGAEAWTVVASHRGGIDPYRCTSILEANRIMARCVNRNDDFTIEVRQKNVADALRMIQANIDWLRVFTRGLVRVQPVWVAKLTASLDRFSKWLAKWSFTLVTLLHFALVPPLAYLWAGTSSDIHMARNPGFLFDDEYFAQQYWLAIRGLLLITIMLLWLRVHWRARDPSGREVSRRDTSQ